MTVLITLTIAGTDTGNFSLFTDVDGFVTPFETGVAKSSLLAGYTTSLVPNTATIIKVKSNATCTNAVDIPIIDIPVTTTTTTTSTTTTTTLPPTTTTTTTTTSTTTTTTLPPTTTTTTTTISPTIQLIAKKVGGLTGVLKYGVNDSSCPNTAGTINTTDTIFTIPIMANTDIFYVEVYVNGVPTDIVPTCVQLGSYCSTYICAADVVYDGSSDIYVQTNVNGTLC